LPEKAKAYVERLQTDVKRLLLTVNDILDMRQIEMGTLTLHKTSASLKKLLVETVETLQIQAEAKQQQLTTHIIEEDCFATVDQYKIERVFCNVIANAIKYTPNGGTITVTLQRHGSMARIWVDDTGIGIPPEALTRVTQPYYRVGDHVAGTGLGLSIVKELIELHQGELTLYSPVPGEMVGTRVQLDLPLSVGPSWVILSGDEAFINDLTHLAEVMGCVPHADNSALDIEAFCANLTPARFFIDGALPESSVEDMIYQIRRSAKLAKTPILILAPKDFSQLRNYAYAQMRIDVRDYPIRPEVLRQL
jgi:anti-sigma regulatory factor (Ser/Thr protein kinase)